MKCKCMRIIEDQEAEPKIVETEEPGDILAEAKEIPIEEVSDDDDQKKSKRTE